MSDILRILQITFGDSEKAIQKAVQKLYTQPYEKQGLPYAKLYKMAQLPYDAIQKAVQYSRKAIQCHTRSCTRWLESHTVRLNCHTMPYTKPYSTAEKPYRKPYTKKDNKKKETTKMEKLKRTFRLSEQAVEAIENRNRKLYPTATDFLEAKILAPADNSTEMLHKISAQLREMESLLVQQYHKKIEEEQPFH